MNNQSDLRQSPRFSVNWPIEYRALYGKGSDGQWYPAEMVDISERGILFTTPSRLAPGTGCLLRIQLPGTEAVVKLRD